MKKFFTTFLMLGPALMISAQVTDAPAVYNQGSISILPGAYTVNGKSLMVFYTDDEYTGITGHSVYDESLNKVLDFAITEPQSYELTQWYQEKIYGPIGAYVYNTLIIDEAIEIDGRTTGLTIDEIRSDMLKYNLELKIITYEGEKVLADATDWYYQEIFGEKYPQRIFKKINDEWFECRIYYASENGPTDIWGERHERTNHDTPSSYVELKLKNEYTDDFYISLSQTLFNDDDKFEYCVPAVKVVDYYEESENYREGGQRLEYTGFDVYTTDGSLVRQFRFPEGYYKDGINLNVIYIGNVKYIAVNNVKKENNYYTLLYRADGNSISSAPALIQMSSSVSPTAPRQGQTVHVDLGVEAEAGCFVSVINAQGREMNRIRVAQGDNSAEVRTDKLSRGVYVVVVKNGEKKHEVSKIVVR